MGAPEVMSVQRQTVDLRGAPLDEWESAKRTQHRDWDPVAEAGLLVTTPLGIGDAYARETRRRAQLAARETQRSRFAVALGASLTLRDGVRLAATEPVTHEQIDHPHAVEILSELVARGALVEIDPDLAFLRSLDPSIGPYVATADVEFSNGRKFTRGQSVREDDCPPPVRPRVITDDMKASDLSVAELRTMMRTVVYSLVPGSAPNVPPPMSEWMAATMIRDAAGLALVMRAPNWVGPADAPPKKKGWLK